MSKARASRRRAGGTLSRSSQVARLALRALRSPARELGLGRGVEQRHAGADQVQPQVGATSSPSAQSMPGAGGTSDPRDAEIARQRRGVQRTGAAEGHEGVAARVVALAARRRCGWRRAMLVCTTETMPRAVSMAEAPSWRASPAIACSARSRSERPCAPPRSCVALSRPSTTLASVTVGARAAAPVAGGARIARPRSAAPPCSAPPESTQAMLPPPAPTVSISRLGMRTG